MGPGYFVIAILGCADGGTSCTQVATVQTGYTTVAECSAASRAVLEENSNFDYPTLLARCRPGTAATTAQRQPEPPQPASARRG